MHGIFEKTIHGDLDPELKILLKLLLKMSVPPNELSPVDKNKYVSGRAVTKSTNMINPTNQKILLAWTATVQKWPYRKIVCNEDRTIVVKSDGGLLSHCCHS